MRWIGLALIMAAAGCSSFPGASSNQPKGPERVDLAAQQKGFQDATTLYANQRYDQAAHLCESIVQARPYYAPAWLLLARSCHAAGKDDSAIPRYRTVLNLSPSHVEALTELAAIYHTRGECDQAVALLERAMEVTDGREDIAEALSTCRMVDALLPREPADDDASPEDMGEETYEETTPEDPPTEESEETEDLAGPVPPPVESESDHPEEAQPLELEDPQPPAAEPAPPKQAQAKPPAEEPQPPKPKAVEPQQKPEPPKPVAKPQPPNPVEKPQPPKAADVQPKPVAEDPPRLSPEARQWLEEGDRSLAEGLAADALEAYRRSQEHGGPHAILASRIEQASKAREEAQRLTRDLSSGLANAQDPTRHRLRLAGAYLQDGRYLEAQLLLIQVTVLAPECGEAFYLLGVAYERRSEWRQAAEAFTRARKLCPDTALDVQAGFHLEDIEAHLDH